MKPQLTRTAAGMAAAITVAVATAFAVGAYLYSQFHFETLLEISREATVAQGELIQEALEHQMLENERDLIGEMVGSFGRRTDIESLAILDHGGRVRYSNDPQEAGRLLSAESPTCQTCHDLPPDSRFRSQVLESEDGTLLRVVVPFQNREPCQRCHNPAQAINGILILGRDVSPMRQAMNRDLRWMVAGSGLLAFLLVGAVAGIVQLLLLRRLQRFETTARLIAEGDLDRRVPVPGSDTISWLAREFNTMADSVTGLLSEVRQQRERLETVINSIDDGIVVLDPRRRIIAANAAFLARTGHVREEVLGCACRDIAGGACDTGDCPTLACLDSGERQVRICERRDGAGRLAWEEVHSSPVFGAAGEIVQVVEVWRDISERRAAEARLAESHRMASVGMLASGFSHEMNTPLGTILTCVEGILREIRADGGAPSAVKRIQETASIARDQVLRCKEITQHFLRLSRGQSSAGDVVEVGSVVRGVTRLVEPTAHARGVELRIDPEDSKLQVRADPAEIQHALVNLLLNAIEACDAGGHVLVHVDRTDSVRIRVTDDGCGIPPDEVTRIFEPFVSLRKGGTGLGLFLSLNFVRRWGGDIRVRSQPDGGSVFEIVLPAMEGVPATEIAL